MVRTILERKDCRHVDKFNVKFSWMSASLTHVKISDIQEILRKDSRHWKKFYSVKIADMSKSLT